MTKPALRRDDGWYWLPTRVSDVEPGPPLFVSVSRLLREAIPQGWAPWYYSTQGARAALADPTRWQQLPLDEACKEIARQVTRSNAAAALGSAIHAGVETYIVTGSLDQATLRAVQVHLDETGSSDLDAAAASQARIEPYLHTFADWCERWQPDWHATETTVFSVEHGWAGTFDALATLPEVGTVLLDTKTGKGPYAEHALQLTAYRWADLVVFPCDQIDSPGHRTPCRTCREEPMPETDGAAVLQLHAHDAALIPVDTSRRVFDWLLRCADVVNAGRLLSKRVIQEPLSPPVAVA